MCTPADGNYTVTYMADAGNSAQCPATPATRTATWPDDSGTGFGPNCMCAGSTLTCTGSGTDDAGVMESETITFMFTSTNFTGTIVAMKGSLTCNYTFTGTKM